MSLVKCFPFLNRSERIEDKLKKQIAELKKKKDSEWKRIDKKYKDMEKTDLNHELYFDEIQGLQRYDFMIHSITNQIKKLRDANK